MNHVMVDLETWDNTPTAVIVSLGAVRMDLERLTVHEEFYAVLDPVDCTRLGLTIGADTVRWWLKQNDAARAIFKAEEPVLSLPEALLRFSQWLRLVGQEDQNAIWGNGATFDNVILRNAYLAAGVPAPWAYHRDFCYRTMKNMFPVPRTERYGSRHNALSDAQDQANHLIEIMRRLKK
jgi:hypothetical protein